MRSRTLVVPALLLLAFATVEAWQKAHGAPETFSANLQVTSKQGGAAAAYLTVDVQRYTPEADRKAVEDALKTGGYPAFVTALRKAPQVGSVAVGDRKWAIRWARERDNGKGGRTITVVTDQPMFFVGGGSADAKPREGYEVAVIHFDVDSVGMGRGVMTAAARVKPGGESGVEVDDYAETPIKLVTVVRKIK